MNQISNYIFLIVFCFIQHSFASQPYRPPEGCLSTKTVIVYKLELDKKKAIAIKQLESKFRDKQKRFENKVMELEAIIFAEGVKGSDFKCVYYRQEPIIFYLAKKDLLSGLLESILDLGADPLQKHPFYINQDTAPTPLTIAQSTGATNNVEVLNRYIKLRSKEK